MEEHPRPLDTAAEWASLRDGAGKAVREDGYRLTATSDEVVDRLAIKSDDRHLGARNLARGEMQVESQHENHTRVQNVQSTDPGVVFADAREGFLTDEGQQEEHDCEDDEVAAGPSDRDRDHEQERNQSEERADEAVRVQHRLIAELLLLHRQV